MSIDHDHSLVRIEGTDMYRGACTCGEHSSVCDFKLANKWRADHARLHVPADTPAPVPQWGMRQWIDEHTATGDLIECASLTIQLDTRGHAGFLEEVTMTSSPAEAERLKLPQAYREEIYVHPEAGFVLIVDSGRFERWAPTSYVWARWTEADHAEG